MKETTSKQLYDRVYSANRYQDFRDAKDQVSLEVFGGECFLCGSTLGYQEYHFHHIAYDPTESSYKRNSKALWTRILRLREATAHPERFRLLCPECHRTVTSLGNAILKKWRTSKKKPNLDTLLDLVMLEVSNRKND